MKKIRYAEITYDYNGKRAMVTEAEEKGYEARYFEYVINRIKQLTNAGAVIVDVRTIETH